MTREEWLKIQGQRQRELNIEKARYFKVRREALEEHCAAICASAEGKREREAERKQLEQDVDRGGRFRFICWGDITELKLWAKR